MLDETQNEFDSMGATETAPESTVTDASTAALPDALADIQPSPEEQDAFDALGSDNEKELPNNLSDSSSKLPPENAASNADGSEKAAAKEENAEVEEVADPEKDDTQTADPEEISPEAKEYINKLSPTEQERAIAAEKGAGLQKSFLNPNFPPEQWIANAKNKSQMRFDQISDAILAEKNAVSLDVAKTDPMKFLTEVFDKTAEGERSETYETLLDTIVGFDPDYTIEALKAKGYELAKAGEQQDSTDLTGSDVAKMSDAEINELEQSEAFERLQDVFPDEAVALQKILDEAKELRAAKAKEDKAAETAEQTAEREAAEAKKAEDDKKLADQQAEQVKAQIQTFETVYEANVTSHVAAKLDTDYGLAVTAAEKESDPTFAFLKEAKKRLILAGGLNGTGDFDNDLKEWGDARPGFTQATASMIAFSRAGEQSNAAAAAAQIKPFADAFLSERLQMPEVKMIDEIIKEVAYARSVKNRVRDDVVPDSYGATTFEDRRTEQDEFDSIKA